MKNLKTFEQHIFSKEEELIENEIISKIEDFDLNDMGDFKNLEPISNAHFFMSVFLKSGEVNRKIRNPFNIEYSEMEKSFGRPNFQDNYKNSNWWILNFEGEIYTVDIKETEGSQICKLFGSERGNRLYDEEFSIDMNNFYKQLFRQIKN